MRDGLRTLSREVLAYARQGALLARERGRSRGAPPSARRAVLFIHGFGGVGPAFDPLRERVEARVGVPTLDFRYRSLRGFEAVARDLAERCERAASAGTRLDLVGHSLGGMLARWYVQELGGAEHVDRVITLATPHAGTRAARLAPGPIREALRPDGAIVRRLRAGRDRAASVAHSALVAGADLLVTPPASAAAIRDADVRWFEGVGHNAMLFDDAVHDAVVEALTPRARSGDETGGSTD